MRRLAWAGVFALIVSCLAFLLVAPAFAYYRHAPIDATASWLAQREVHVRCQSPRESRNDPIVVHWGASAYVEGWYDRRGYWHPYDYTVFAFGHCGPLMALVRGEPYSDEEVAWALLVLVHESGHLRGHRWSADEGLTQRWALRHFVYVAMRFTDEAHARSFLRLAVESHLRLPEEYRAPGCRWPWVDAAGVLRDCK